jgi:hypothetical protein
MTRSRKTEGVGTRGAVVDAEHLVGAAIVDRGVLVDAWPDLADVHPDAVPGDRAAAASFALAPPSLQRLLAMTDERPMNSIERERQVVLPYQLSAIQLRARPSCERAAMEIAP